MVCPIIPFIDRRRGRLERRLEVTGVRPAAPSFEIPGSEPYPADFDLRETRTVKADGARVRGANGHGSSSRSPRDWWCLGWIWVLVALIEIAGALRDGSGLQLGAGTVTLVLAALWVVISLRRSGRPWRAIREPS